MAIAHGYDMSVEVWKVIPEFPDYEVSTFGRHRRCRGGSRNSKLGQPLVLGVSGGSKAYRTFALYKDGKVVTRLAHRVVLTVFVGPPPTAKHQGAHEDDTPANNRLDNLKWATAKENSADRVRRGRQASGVSHPNTRLTDNQIAAIRKLRQRKVGVYLIAAAVGVSASAVGRIVRGETYK